MFPVVTHSIIDTTGTKWGGQSTSPFRHHCLWSHRASISVHIRVLVPWTVTDSTDFY